jgi:sulfite exporter TauE/SafE
MSPDWLTIGAALLAGLLGGAHCAAMCGGIATGFQALAKRPGWTSAVESNLGRVAGYVLAGAIAGGLGQGIVRIARVEWLAIGARMLVGAVLVLAALRLSGLLGPRRGFAGAGSGMWTWLRPLQARLLPIDSRPKRIAAGMLWGWLPCGLSTTLLAAAWFQASAANGALTMAAFGLGTLPVMLPLTWSGARLGRWLHDPVRRGSAAGLVLVAGLVTLASPWLMHAPGVSGVLVALGCLPAAL